MSAKNILIDVATIGGIKIDDKQQQAYALMRINQAAEELYNRYDLIGSLREQVFSVAVDTGMQVTLPYYVGKVRAVRYYSPNARISTVDMRPKYAARFWQSGNFLDWRLKGRTALMRDITNASVVTINFTAPLITDVTVTISGATDIAAQDTESITIVADNQNAATTKNWNSIESISKSSTTNSDCTILDIDGNILAVLPNNQLTSQYQLVQIVNLSNMTGGGTQPYTPVTPYVELLWKRPFQPFVNLTDEFLCPDYDKAIFWQFMAHKMSAPPADMDSARAYGAQAANLIKDIANDNDQNIKKSLNFASNPIYDAFEGIRTNTSESPSNISNPLVWP